MHAPSPESSSRTRLLEAAILCFAEKGFDATGIREIAQRAKANSALVQYHFGGKTGLYAEALRHIFTNRPTPVPPGPPRPDEPEALARTIQAMGELILGLLTEALAGTDGSELDRASMTLVTREIQNPRQDMTPLVLEHILPHKNYLQACLAVLAPGLGASETMDCIDSVFGQVVHVYSNLRMIRIMRNDPEYPRDLRAVAEHITRFSLRGIGVP